MRLRVGGTTPPRNASKCFKWGYHGWVICSLTYDSGVMRGPQYHGMVSGDALREAESHDSWGGRRESDRPKPTGLRGKLHEHGQNGQVRQIVLQFDALGHFCNVRAISP